MNCPQDCCGVFLLGDWRIPGGELGMGDSEGVAIYDFSPSVHHSFGASQILNVVASTTKGIYFKR